MIYEMTHELAQVIHDLEGIETLDAQTFNDTVAAFEQPYKEKMIGLAKWVTNLKASAEAKKAEAKRLTEKARVEENKIKWLEETIFNNVKVGGNIKDDIMPIKLVKKPACLGAVDESQVPDEFFNVIPESKKLDRRALLAAAKASEIEGVEVITDGQRLKIG